MILRIICATSTLQTVDKEPVYLKKKFFAEFFVSFPYNLSSIQQGGADFDFAIKGKTW